MKPQLSEGWMRLALRGRICAQCDPPPRNPDLLKLHDAHVCEAECPLFTQLPRLARFLTRHNCKPPVGYEEYAINLLKESAPGNEGWSARDLSIADDALATLEKVARLVQIPVLNNTDHVCPHVELTMGQLKVLRQTDLA